MQRSKEVRANAGLMLDSLQPVVMRYLVWSRRTASVEQRFSVGDRLGVDRTPTSQESLTLRAVFDEVGADERKEVVKRAQELFAEGCPKARNPPHQSKRDKGTNMSSKTKASAEIGWLARRRNIVTAATKLPKAHELVGPGIWELLWPILATL